MKSLFNLCLFTCATALLAGLLSGPLQAQAVTATPPTEARVRFSIVKTSKVAVVERLLVPGGSYTQQVDTNFSAFLIQHHQDYVLLDTGLGPILFRYAKQDLGNEADAANHRDGGC